MKWHYIKLISNMSNKSDDKLLKMLDYYNKISLREITFDEAKEFYEKNKDVC